MFFSPKKLRHFVVQRGCVFSFSREIGLFFCPKSLRDFFCPKRLRDFFLFKRLHDFFLSRSCMIFFFREVA